ncbi:MAG TPA: hypothetical protein VKR56_02085 [Candidatus Cybelea sp.]|jgi:hypothetical protein|nr:hypothetical protein [Candidatus Cybelea sp.]
MYSVIRKDAPCAGKLFLVWGAFGLGLAAVWDVAHGNPVADAAIWAVGLVAAAGLLLGMREL